MVRKKAVRKKHVVHANMQVLELARAGSSIDFEIYANKEKIGHIVIGRGSFTWRGRNRQKEKRFSWTRFSELMDREVYGE